MDLCKRYWHRIFGYCYRLLQDRFHAEDATQNTFLKMLQALDTLRHANTFQCWLFTIARNEALCYLRKRNNSEPSEEDSIWTSTTSFDEEYFRAETSEIVQKYLSLLKPEYREVLILREYEQLSYAQIAVITQISEANVKARIHRARIELGKKLKPYYG
ncbi:MAG: RNA polymerase sigma factor [bacterium]